MVQPTWKSAVRQVWKSALLGNRSRHEPRRQSEFSQRAILLAALKEATCRSLFAKRSLQPRAHRRSNAPMQVGDFTQAARPRPTRAKLTNQELIPRLGTNINLVGKLSYLLNS